MATGTIEIYNADGDLLSVPYMDILPKSFSFRASITSSEEITSYLWDFGDGQTSSFANPTHSYSTFGYHYVFLTVTDANNIESVIALPDPIMMAILDFEATPEQGRKPLTVQFTNKSAPPQGLFLENWEWNFGDTNTESGTRDPQHTYVENGNFNVTLSAELRQP